MRSSCRAGCTRRLKRSTRGVKGHFASFVQTRRPGAASKEQRIAHRPSSADRQAHPERGQSVSAGRCRLARRPGTAPPWLGSAMRARDELTGSRLPTQVGRALDELGIRRIHVLTVRCPVQVTVRIAALRHQIRRDLEGAPAPRSRSRSAAAARRAARPCHRVLSTTIGPARHRTGRRRRCPAGPTADGAGSPRSPRRDPNCRGCRSRCRTAGSRPIARNSSRSSGSAGRDTRSSPQTGGQQTSAIDEGCRSMSTATHSRRALLPSPARTRRSRRCRTRHGQ